MEVFKISKVLSLRVVCPSCGSSFIHREECPVAVRLRVSMIGAIIREEFVPSIELEVAR